MAWIEYHDTLWDFWKIQRLSLKLHVSYAHALGVVSCLWLWAVRNARDGTLKRFTDQELAEAARWDGKPRFTKALLIECGLLDRGTHKLHEWEQYGTRLLDASRARQRRHRHDTEALRDRHITVT